MRCDEHLELVVPFLRGELAPLPRARLESHLAHCQRCAEAHRDLAAGLAAARTWSPELSPESLDRHVARLAPYLEARSQSRTPYLAAAAALAAGLLAVAGVWWITGEAPHPAAESEEPTMLFDFSDGLAFDVHPGEPDLVRHQPTPYVRLLAPREWDGSMVRTGRRTVINMSRGFVAVAFQGGKGRRMRVRTPAVQVDVVGTRFVVDVAQDGTTTVAVSHGRVRVRVAGRVRGVAAGEVYAVDARGTRVQATAPASTRFLQDEFLVALPSRSLSRPQTPPACPEPCGRAMEPVAEVPISDVLEQLARAEELAGEDQVAAAVTIFESCAEDPHEAYDPYRDLCRLELARLMGFSQGRVAAARALLEHLAARPGSVGHEATLALCELDLERSPCRTRACLESVAARGDPDLRREANNLLARWRLEERVCP